MLQGLARYGNPEAHRHNQALLTSFEGLYIELPGGDLVRGDALLLVAVGRDSEPVTLQSDCHQWRGRDLFHLWFARSAEVLKELSISLKRPGEAHLDSCRLAKFHPIRWVEQQPAGPN